MKNRALATVISGALMAAPMAVMADPGQFILTPFVGVQTFDHDRDASDNGMWGVGGEYQFNDHFGAEIDYAHSFDDMEAGSDDVTYDRLSLDGIYYLGTFAKVWKPYLKFGVGHDRYDYKNAAEDQNTDIDAGLGVRVNVTDRFSWRVEAKALHEVDDSQTHGLYTLGFGYAFGGASKPVEKPAPAPVAVAAPPAPVDSDGDGVIDDNDKCPNTPRGLEVDANGCEYHLTKTEETRIDVKFATNKSDITEEYAGEVERIAKFLRKYASVRAEIAGHTDSVGSDAYNLKLSQRRADAVKAMLVTRFNIDSSRLTAVGYGETKPIASNETADGRAQNRRVVAVMQAETTEAVKKK
jgi:OmpA-OmpF porin, OOP family